MKSRGIGPGTITWSEHESVWRSYAARYGRRQDAETIARRGGFGYGEIVMLTGTTPRTFEPTAPEYQCGGHVEFTADGTVLHSPPQDPEPSVEG